MVEIWCDSAELLKNVLDAGLSTKKAARLAGMSARQFGKLLTGNRRVQVCTAGKLRRNFGEHVVRVSRSDGDD